MVGGRPPVCLDGVVVVRSGRWFSLDPVGVPPEWVVRAPAVKGVVQVRFGPGALGAVVVRDALRREDPGVVARMVEVLEPGQAATISLAEVVARTAVHGLYVDLPQRADLVDAADGRLVPIDGWHRAVSPQRAAGVRVVPVRHMVQDRPAAAGEVASWGRMSGQLRLRAEGVELGLPAAVLHRRRDLLEAAIVPVLADGQMVAGTPVEAPGYAGLLTLLDDVRAGSVSSLTVETAAGDALQLFVAGERDGVAVVDRTAQPAVLPARPETIRLAPLTTSLTHAGMIGLSERVRARIGIGDGEQYCLALASAALEELFGNGPDDGISVAGIRGADVSLDDSILTMGPLPALGSPRDWPTIAGGWTATGQIVGAVTGRAAVVHLERPGRVGHVVVAVGTEDGVRWLDPAQPRPQDRVREHRDITEAAGDGHRLPSAESDAGLRARIFDTDGRLLPHPPAPVPSADAVLPLLDAPDPRVAGAGFEAEQAPTLWIEGVDNIKNVRSFVLAEHPSGMLRIAVETKLAVQGADGLLYATPAEAEAATGTADDILVGKPELISGIMRVQPHEEGRHDPDAVFRALRGLSAAAARIPGQDGTRASVSFEQYLRAAQLDEMTLTNLGRRASLGPPSIGEPRGEHYHMSLGIVHDGMYELLQNLLPGIWKDEANGWLNQAHTADGLDFGREIGARFLHWRRTGSLPEPDGTPVQPLAMTAPLSGQDSSDVRRGLKQVSGYAALAYTNAAGLAEYTVVAGNPKSLVAALSRIDFIDVWADLPENAQEYLRADLNAFWENFERRFRARIPSFDDTYREFVEPGAGDVELRSLNLTDGDEDRVELADYLLAPMRGDTAAPGQREVFGGMTTLHRTDVNDAALLVPHEVVEIRADLGQQLTVDRFEERYRQAAAWSATAYQQALLLPADTRIGYARDWRGSAGRFPQRAGLHWLGDDNSPPPAWAIELGAAASAAGRTLVVLHTAVTDRRGATRYTDERMNRFGDLLDANWPLVRSALFVLTGYHRDVHLMAQDVNLPRIHPNAPTRLSPGQRGGLHADKGWRLVTFDNRVVINRGDDLSGDFVAQALRMVDRAAAQVPGSVDLTSAGVRQQVGRLAAGVLAGAGVSGTAAWCVAVAAVVRDAHFGGLPVLPAGATSADDALHGMGLWSRWGPPGSWPRIGDWDAVERVVSAEPGRLAVVLMSRPGGVGDLDGVGHAYVAVNHGRGVAWVNPQTPGEPYRLQTLSQVRADDPTITADLRWRVYGSDRREIALPVVTGVPATHQLLAGAQQYGAPPRLKLTEDERETLQDLWSHRADPASSAALAAWLRENGDQVQRRDLAQVFDVDGKPVSTATVTSWIERADEHPWASAVSLQKIEAHRQHGTPSRRKLTEDERETLQHLWSHRADPDSSAALAAWLRENGDQVQRPDLAQAFDVNGKPVSKQTVTRWIERADEHPWSSLQGIEARRARPLTADETEELSRLWADRETLDGSRRLADWLRANGDDVSSAELAATFIAAGRPVTKTTVRDWLSRLDEHPWTSDRAGRPQAARGRHLTADERDWLAQRWTDRADSENSVAVADWMRTHGAEVSHVDLAEVFATTKTTVGRWVKRLMTQQNPPWEAAHARTRIGVKRSRPGAEDWSSGAVEEGEPAQRSAPVIDPDLLQALVGRQDWDGLADEVSRLLPAFSLTDIAAATGIDRDFLEAMAGPGPSSTYPFVGMAVTDVTAPDSALRAQHLVQAAGTDAAQRQWMLGELARAAAAHGTAVRTFLAGHAEHADHESAVAVWEHFTDVVAGAGPDGLSPVVAVYEQVHALLAEMGPGSPLPSPATVLTREAAPTSGRSSTDTGFTLFDDNLRDLAHAQVEQGNHLIEVLSGLLAHDFIKESVWAAWTVRRNRSKLARAVADLEGRAEDLARMEDARTATARIPRQVRVEVRVRLAQSLENVSRVTERAGHRIKQLIEDKAIRAGLRAGNTHERAKKSLGYVSSALTAAAPLAIPAGAALAPAALELGVKAAAAASLEAFQRWQEHVYRREHSSGEALLAHDQDPLTMARAIVAKQEQAIELLMAAAGIGGAYVPGWPLISSAITKVLQGYLQERVTLAQRDLEGTTPAGQDRWRRAVDSAWDRLHHEVKAKRTDIGSLQQAFNTLHGDPDYLGLANIASDAAVEAALGALLAVMPPRPAEPVTGAMLRTAVLDVVGKLKTGWYTPQPTQPALRSDESVPAGVPTTDDRGRPIQAYRANYSDEEHAYVAVEFSGARFWGYLNRFTRSFRPVRPVPAGPEVAERWFNRVLKNGRYLELPPEGSTAKPTPVPGQWYRLLDLYYGFLRESDGVLEVAGPAYATSRMSTDEHNIHLTHLRHPQWVSNTFDWDPPALLTLDFSRSEFTPVSDLWATRQFAYAIAGRLIDDHTAPHGPVARPQVHVDGGGNRHPVQTAIVRLLTEPGPRTAPGHRRATAVQDLLARLVSEEMRRIQRERDLTDADLPQVPADLFAPVVDRGRSARDGAGSGRRQRRQSHAWIEYRAATPATSVEPSPVVSADPRDLDPAAPAPEPLTLAAADEMSLLAAQALSRMTTPQPGTPSAADERYCVRFAAAAVVATFPEGLAPGRTADDSVLDHDAGLAWDRPAAWPRAAGWNAVAEMLRPGRTDDAGAPVEPGRIAVVLMGRPGGLGHAFVAVRTSSGEIGWLDAPDPGRAVRMRSHAELMRDGLPQVDLRVRAYHHDRTPVRGAPEPPESASTARSGAAPGTGYGLLGGEMESLARVGAPIAGMDDPRRARWSARPLALLPGLGVNLVLDEAMVTIGGSGTVYRSRNEAAMIEQTLRQQRWFIVEAVTYPGAVLDHELAAGGPDALSAHRNGKALLRWVYQAGQRGMTLGEAMRPGEDPRVTALFDSWARTQTTPPARASTEAVRAAMFHGQVIVDSELTAERLHFPEQVASLHIGQQTTSGTPLGGLVTVLEPVYPPTVRHPHLALKAFTARTGLAVGADLARVYVRSLGDRLPADRVDLLVNLSEPLQLQGVVAVVVTHLMAVAYSLPVATGPASVELAKVTFPGHPDSYRKNKLTRLLRHSLATAVRRLARSPRDFVEHNAAYLVDIIGRKMELADPNLAALNPAGDWLDREFPLDPTGGREGLNSLRQVLLDAFTMAGTIDIRSLFGGMSVFDVREPEGDELGLLLLEHRTVLGRIPLADGSMVAASPTNNLDQTDDNLAAAADLARAAYQAAADAAARSRQWDGIENAVRALSAPNSMTPQVFPVSEVALDQPAAVPVPPPIAATRAGLRQQLATVRGALLTHDAAARAATDGYSEEALDARAAWEAFTAGLDRAQERVDNVDLAAMRSEVNDLWRAYDLAATRVVALAPHLRSALSHVWANGSQVRPAFAPGPGVGGAAAVFGLTVLHGGDGGLAAALAIAAGLPEEPAGLTPDNVGAAAHRLGLRVVVVHGADVHVFGDRGHREVHVARHRDPEGVHYIPLASDPAFPEMPETLAAEAVGDAFTTLAVGSGNELLRRARMLLPADHGAATWTSEGARSGGSVLRDLLSGPALIERLPQALGPDGLRLRAGASRAGRQRPQLVLRARRTGTYRMLPAETAGVTYQGALDVTMEWRGDAGGRRAAAGHATVQMPETVRRDAPAAAGRETPELRHVSRHERLAVGGLHAGAVVLGAIDDDARAAIGRALGRLHTAEEVRRLLADSLATRQPVRSGRGTARLELSDPRPAGYVRVGGSHRMVIRAALIVVADTHDTTSVRHAGTVELLADMEAVGHLARRHADLVPGSEPQPYLDPPGYPEPATATPAPADRWARLTTDPLVGFDAARFGDLVNQARTGAVGASAGPTEVGELLAWVEAIGRVPDDAGQIAARMGLPGPAPLIEAARHLVVDVRGLDLLGEPLAAGMPVREWPDALARYGVENADDVVRLAEIGARLGLTRDDLPLFVRFREHGVALELLHALPDGYLTAVLDTVRRQRRIVDAPDSGAHELGLPDETTARLLSRALGLNPVDLALLGAPLQHAVRDVAEAVDRERPDTDEDPQRWAERVAAAVSAGLQDAGTGGNRHWHLTRELGFPVRDLAFLVPSRHVELLAYEFLGDVPLSRVAEELHLLAEAHPEPSAELAASLPRNRYSAAERQAWSQRLGVADEVFDSFVDAPFGDPAAVLLAANRAGLGSGALPRIMGLAYTIGRVPTDLGPLALRMDVPASSLLDVATGLEVDPRVLAPFRSLLARIDPEDEYAPTAVTIVDSAREILEDITPIRATRFRVAWPLRQGTRGRPPHGGRYALDPAQLITVMQRLRERPHEPFHHAESALRAAVDRLTDQYDFLAGTRPGVPDELQAVRDWARDQLTDHDPDPLRREPLHRLAERLPEAGQERLAAVEREAYAAYTAAAGRATATFDHWVDAHDAELAAQQADTAYGQAAAARLRDWLVRQSAALADTVAEVALRAEERAAAHPSLWRAEDLTAAEADERIATIVAGLPRPRAAANPAEAWADDLGAQTDDVWDHPALDARAVRDLAIAADLPTQTARDISVFLSRVPTELPGLAAAWGVSLRDVVQLSRRWSIDPVLLGALDWTELREREDVDDEDFARAVEARAAGDVRAYVLRLSLGGRRENDSVPAAEDWELLAAIAGVRPPVVPRDQVAGTRLRRWGMLMNRLSEALGMDEIELTRLTARLAVPASWVRALAVRIGHLPVDLPERAARLGVADPGRLFALAAHLGVDPASIPADPRLARLNHEGETRFAAVADLAGDLEAQLPPDDTTLNDLLWELHQHTGRVPVDIVERAAESGRSVRQLAELAHRLHVDPRVAAVAAEELPPGKTEDLAERSRRWMARLHDRYGIATADIWQVLMTHLRPSGYRYRTLDDLPARDAERELLAYRVSTGVFRQHTAAVLAEEPVDGLFDILRGLGTATRGRGAPPLIGGLQVPDGMEILPDEADRAPARVRIRTGFGADDAAYVRLIQMYYANLPTLSRMSALAAEPDRAQAWQRGGYASVQDLLRRHTDPAAPLHLNVRWRSADTVTFAVGARDEPTRRGAAMLLAALVDAARDPRPPRHLMGRLRSAGAYHESTDARHEVAVRELTRRLPHPLARVQVAAVFQHGAWPPERDGDPQPPPTLGPVLADRTLAVPVGDSGVAAALRDAPETAGLDVAALNRLGVRLATASGVSPVEVLLWLAGPDRVLARMNPGLELSIAEAMRLLAVGRAAIPPQSVRDAYRELHRLSRLTDPQRAAWLAEQLPRHEAAWTRLLNDGTRPTADPDPAVRVDAAWQQPLLPVPADGGIDAWLRTRVGQGLHPVPHDAGHRGEMPRTGFTFALQAPVRPSGNPWTSVRPDSRWELIESAADRAGLPGAVLRRAGETMTVTLADLGVLERPWRQIGHLLRVLRGYGARPVPASATVSITLPGAGTATALDMLIAAHRPALLRLGADPAAGRVRPLPARELVTVEGDVATFHLFAATLDLPVLQAQTRLAAALVRTAATEPDAAEPDTTQPETVRGEPVNDWRLYGPPDPGTMRLLERLFPEPELRWQALALWHTTPWHPGDGHEGLPLGVSATEATTLGLHTGPQDDAELLRREDYRYALPLLRHAHPGLLVGDVVHAPVPERFWEGYVDRLRAVVASAGPHAASMLTTRAGAAAQGWAWLSDLPYTTAEFVDRNTRPAPPSPVTRPPVVRAPEGLDGLVRHHVAPTVLSQQEQGPGGLYAAVLAAATRQGVPLPDGIAEARDLWRLLADLVEDRPDLFAGVLNRGVGPLLAGYLSDWWVRELHPAPHPDRRTEIGRLIDAADPQTLDRLRGLEPDGLNPQDPSEVLIDAARSALDEGGDLIQAVLRELLTDRSLLTSALGGAVPAMLARALDLNLTIDDGSRQWMWRPGAAHTLFLADRDGQYLPYGATAQPEQTDISQTEDPDSGTERSSSPEPFVGMALTDVTVPTSTGDALAAVSSPPELIRVLERLPAEAAHLDAVATPLIGEPDSTAWAAWAAFRSAVHFAAPTDLVGARTRLESVVAAYDFALTHLPAGSLPDPTSLVDALRGAPSPEAVPATPRSLDRALGQAAGVAPEGLGARDEPAPLVVDFPSGSDVPAADPEDLRDFARSVLRSVGHVSRQTVDGGLAVRVRIEGGGDGGLRRAGVVRDRLIEVVHNELNRVRTRRGLPDDVMPEVAALFADPVSRAFGSSAAAGDRSGERETAPQQRTFTWVERAGGEQVGISPSARDLYASITEDDLLAPPLWLSPVLGQRNRPAENLIVLSDGDTARALPHGLAEAARLRPGQTLIFIGRRLGQALTPALLQDLSVLLAQFHDAGVTPTVLVEGAAPPELSAVLHGAPVIDQVPAGLNIHFVARTTVGGAPVSPGTAAVTAGLLDAAARTARPAAERVSALVGSATWADDVRQQWTMVQASSSELRTRETIERLRQTVARVPQARSPRLLLSQFDFFGTSVVPDYVAADDERRPRVLFTEMARRHRDAPGSSLSEFTSLVEATAAGMAPPDRVPLDFTVWVLDQVELIRQGRFPEIARSYPKTKTAQVKQQMAAAIGEFATTMADHQFELREFAAIVLDC
ncbi:hypothetical protein [Mangrovihabitans endophyticus]|uniref:Papain fold toxin 1, glutamine deamidase n=1 Tax=Mangrovihabitans endophyticus TaxID=1751298 RepID=A0A8J3BUM4_9ACTN|nr:hypothetical protein [Mangrovihabitans endophyticus]GGK78852.1 hypothetical protein GCM10012284_10970 [Mangrovihabitans endophyticus]